MVVRVNEVFLGGVGLVAEVAAQDFGRTVGNHFVHVHVGLRAGTGLPNGEREVAVQLAGEDFLAGLRDGVHATIIELAELLVGQSAGTLEHCERAGDLHRHLFNADLEVFVAALRLGAPVLLVRDLNLTHGVLLNTKCHFSLSSYKY